MAQKILNAKKSGQLDAAKAKELFRSAKSDSKFQPSKIDRYISAAAAGRKDYMSAVGNLKAVTLSFFMTQNHYDELKEKYVEDGPFGSVNELMYAVLKGEKSVKIPFAKGV